MLNILNIGLALLKLGALLRAELRHAETPSTPGNSWPRLPSALRS